MSPLDTLQGIAEQAAERQTMDLMRKIHDQRIGWLLCRRGLVAWRSDSPRPGRLIGTEKVPCATCASKAFSAGRLLEHLQAVRDTARQHMTLENLNLWDEIYLDILKGDMLPPWLRRKL